MEAQTMYGCNVTGCNASNIQLQLTSCGHVICENHIMTIQSTNNGHCPYCSVSTGMKKKTFGLRQLNKNVPVAMLGQSKEEVTTALKFGLQFQDNQVRINAQNKEIVHEEDHARKQSQFQEAIDKLKEENSMLQTRLQSAMSHHQNKSQNSNNFMNNFPQINQEEEIQDNSC